MNLPDLHCHSTFSSAITQGDALGTPKDVVERAVELGWGAAALTEHGWIGSAPTFYQLCRQHKIKPILGCEFYVIPDRELMKEKAYHLTVLALSAEGYFNLVAWTTFANKRENFHLKPRISLEEMYEIAPYSLRHNVVLTGCLGSELANCLCPRSENGETGEWRTGGTPLGLVIGHAYVDGLTAIFDHVYLEFSNHRSEKRMGVGFHNYEKLVEAEEMYRARILALAEVSGIPVVVTNDSHYQTPSQRKAHLALQATSWRHREGNYGESSERLAEKYASEYPYWLSYMRPMEKVADGIERGRDALRSIEEIVDEVSIELDPLDKFNYSIPFSGYDDPIAKMRRRSKARLEKLVKKHGEGARERFEHELESMGDFAHYLLMMSDFIIYARKQGILTNTRGSAANSLLCYCLKIHNIDPIEYKLTFSRFFNPARKKLPDIDIDIEQERFSDFMEFVKEYVAEREGEGQVRPISTYGTVANRSAFRLIAEALGIGKEQTDEIAKLLPQMIDSGMVEDENEAYEVLKHDFPEIHELASGVFDSIKNVGQHACGWVFGTKDRPLDQWVPSVLIVSSNTQVSAFNLKSIEEFGLVKGDFLRLRTLSVVKRTLELTGRDALDLEKIPLDDADTFQMLRDGRTEGVFTLQGAPTRKGCMEFEVDSVADVIATVAICRPALMRPGYDKIYNARRLGQEDVEYPHEIAETVLGETHGMAIYQEQSMELGYAIGMDDGEVDELYQAIKLAKGIGRGAKEAFAKLEPKFYDHALEIMNQEEADGVWNLLSSFQGYGFNRGHATSYGKLAVQSAYLRCHHLAEFFAALLDVYPEKSRYIAAARGEGFRFAAPSANSSRPGFSLGRKPNEILVGLSRIDGLGPVAVAEIVRGQPFASVSDFKERTTRRALNKTRIETLAAIGAFSDLGVKADRDDLLEFEKLGFTLDKPKAFAGCKYRHVRPRASGDWTHQGLVRGVEYTDPRTSVSKAFWIPPLGEKSKKKLIEVKAGFMGKTQATLLLVIDSNGIPFHLIANSDREGNVKILEFLAKKCKGCVVVCEGSIRQPFVNNGPMGFRFYNVAGAFRDEAQLFHAPDDRYPAALNELHRRKRMHG